jgi:hypothetical protein
LDVGSWKLGVGSWKLEVGSQKSSLRNFRNLVTPSPYSLNPVIS